MKRTLLAISCALLFCFPSLAQTYDTTTYYGKMNYTFDHLDKTQITTGLLRDYGIDFQDPANYNGTALTDSNWANIDDWRALYATLYSEQISNAAHMLYLDTLNRAMAKYAQSGQPIAFLALYYNYQVLDTLAITKNLITVTNEQLYDVAGRTQSPYLMRSAFGIATTQQSVYTGSNSFIFRSELFKTNTAKTISTIQLDPLGTGTYQTVTMNTAFSVNYPDTGLYRVTVKVTYTDGTIIYAHTKMAAHGSPGGSAFSSPGISAFSSLAASAFSDAGSSAFKGSGPPFIPKQSWIYGSRYPYTPLVYLTADKLYSGVAGQGDIYIDYAKNNSTGQIRKPLIVVEGFDPETASTDYPYNGYTRYDWTGSINYDLNNYNYISLNPGLDDNNDYDLIFVHWKNGSDYIQRNAYLLEKVISYVNTQKTTYSGVRQKNVIIGLSMGGLVVRYALRDMELTGVDHDTRLFISHDAPHWGANVPVSYQALVQHLAPWKLINAGFQPNGFPFYIQWRDMFPSAVDGVATFNSPAAKQMLIQRYILTSSSGALTVDNSQHVAFMNEINTMGWPLLCRTVALSNGSCSGNVLFPDNSQLVRIFGAQSLGTYFGNIWRSAAMTFAGATKFIWDPAGTIPSNNLSLLLQYPLSFLTTSGTLNIDFGAWAVPKTGTALIYKGDVYTKRKILGLFTVTSYFIKCHVNSSTDMLPLDNAPGGVYDASKFGLDVTSINDQLHKQIGNWVNATLLQPRFCFVPTVSSLSLLNPQSNLFTNLCNDIACLKPAAVTDYYAPTQSQLHISYTQANTDWILQQQNPTFSCIKVCPGQLSISPNPFCTTGQFTVNNLPAGYSAAWTAAPAGIISISPTGSATKTINGTAYVTASITSSCLTSGFSISDSIRVGPPTYIPLQLNYLYTSGGQCTQTAQSFQLLSSNGKTLYQNKINDVAWKTILAGPAPTKVMNAGSYYTPGSTYVNNSAITLNFPYNTNLPASATIQVQAANVCGWSGGDEYDGLFKTPANGIVPFRNCSGPSIMLSPNPADNTVVIAESTGAAAALSNNKVIAKTEITIYDQLNRLRQRYSFGRSKTYQVNVAALEPGVYTVVVKTGDEVSSVKLLKK